MASLLTILPFAEDGILPYYLLVVSVAAIGNSVQNLLTLHFTRRIYNGLFVADSSAKPDSVTKLEPVVSATTLKDKPTATDQVTPLAARLFGVYTILAGLIRVYSAYEVNDAALYQLSLLTHLVAAGHFTSEIVVFKTIRLGWEHAFPLSAAFGGSIWMALQYGHYVKA
ncbi:ergosterol biosynthesis protein [Cytospora paraplurivora]|uniref:Ergosterol biosynthesis protein n=1 Tax=Cytospora paraplurivora TaxID=2898453 RepID=A0AAN9YDR0_9PEZI